MKKILRAGFVAILVLGFTLAMTESSMSSSEGPARDLDVMFIGAHPDDEASGLSTYGQWNEYEGVDTGVITITRGEGGGNAVGPEEGAELGLLREGEERRAVGEAGIENIYNLDAVDFYYTVSAPLTEEIWDHDRTLEKIVRVLRYTQPEVIVTMDPAPSPGNHGNHQYAGRLAIEAFEAAADPNAFPKQLSEEGLRTWRPARIFKNSAAGEPLTGEDCAADFKPEESTDDVFGVWGGRESERNDGRLWEQVEREAQQIYRSQGWAAFPDASDDPSEATCDYFTQIDSRVPFDAEDTSPTAMLEGAVLHEEGSLPLGTEFYLTTNAFDVSAGESFTVTAHAKSSESRLPDSNVALGLPEGWTVQGDGDLGTVGSDESTTTFEVTPSADTSVDQRYRVEATLTSGEMQGKTTEVVNVSPDVVADMEQLPQVAQYREWARSVGMPQISDSVKPVLPIGSEASRPVRIDLSNHGEKAQSGRVELSLPDGFTAEPATREYRNLRPGSRGSVSFEVVNEDETLNAGMAGGTEGDYDFEITTTSDSSESRTDAALNIVPTTEIEALSDKPQVDGVESDGEYTGESIDISNFWEGEEADSENDASGSAKVGWSDDALYFLIDVTDDELGSVLTPRDAKRHWRTDAVEIAIDPTGDSENTSTTFKAGLFPKTDDPENGDPPAAYRDADAYQGPSSETALGMEVASTVSEPYEGYTLEAKIPFGALPTTIDPQNLALDALIYDSDTQDKTGQTRLGWSAWPGVQGDPYRWGVAPLSNFDGKPTDASVEEPIIPTEAARSEASPASILQSAEDRVPLSGSASLRDPLTVSLLQSQNGDEANLSLRSKGSGEANVFVWDGESVTEHETVTLVAGEERVLGVRTGERASDATVLIGFRDEDGNVSSSTLPLSLMETGGPGLGDLWRALEAFFGDDDAGGPS